MESMLITEAGLTEGEAKVYLALLKLGSTTTGPLIEESGVANSIIYRILERLIEKGLASYIIKEKTKYFQAADPKRILDYIEERKQKLDDSKEKLSGLIPQLIGLGMAKGKTSVRIFEGFKGLQTAYEQVYLRLKRGEEMYSLGVYSFQEEKYHIYWQKDHIKRGKLGITVKMLFNRDTDPAILQNRNSYKGAEARYMPGDVATPAWIMLYKDVSIIFLQSKEPLAVEIINQDIADTFMAYFNDYWSRSRPFVYKKSRKVQK